MLESLLVKNFVLISELELDLSNGLSVITGETGSGKSIILGALGLILGEKGDKELVRRGAKMAEISAVFSVEPGSALETFLRENEIEAEDGTVTVRRVIKDSGRNVISIADSLVSRQTLEKFGFYAVEVSSQHAHQTLLKESEQLKIVDRFASNQELLNSYQEAYARYRKAVSELEDFKALEEKSRGEEDYLRYCVKEIESINPKTGEDDALKAELERLSAAELLSAAVEDAISSLDNSDNGAVLSSLSHASQFLKKASSKDESLNQYLERIESVLIETEDITESLREYLRSFSFSEAEIDEMNERLSKLQRLKKKYGATLEIVEKKHLEMVGKLNAIEFSEDRRGELETEVKKALEEVKALSDKLTVRRKKAARSLSEDIEKNLCALGMEAAHFTVALTPCQFSSSGSDSVSFLIAANKGEKEGPVRDTASGGELSRIMLAIKASLSRYDNASMLVFDEVDAGIGGRVALAVANMIKELSLSHQTLVITHLAQIAAKADHHYLVEKQEEGGRTLSSISLIEGKEREKEIARLLSGETSDISIEHAKAMLMQN
jgi:DNA repair protein RecN